MSKMFHAKHSQYPSNVWEKCSESQLINTSELSLPMTIARAMTQHNGRSVWIFVVKLDQPNLAMLTILFALTIIQDTNFAANIFETQLASKTHVEVSNSVTGSTNKQRTTLIIVWFKNNTAYCSWEFVPNVLSVKFCKRNSRTNEWKIIENILIV